MKKFILLAVMTAAIFGCTEKVVEGYSIKGSTNGFDGKIYLQVLEGKFPVTIDSTIVKEGVFAFSGKVDMPIAAQFSDSTGKGMGLFYIENSAIAIDFDNKATQKLKVSGSKEDSLYRVYNTLMDTVTTDFGYGVTTSEFIEKNPKSFAAAYVLFRLMSPRLDAAGLREYHAKFDTSVHKSIYLKKVVEKANLLDKTAIGTQFTDFELPNVDGQMVKLSDIAGKGKWVLLDFWASWCAPCRKENPNIVAAFEQFGKRGFTVFGVSLDKNKEAWIDGIAKDKLNWTNVSDLKFWQCTPANMYGVSAIPSNVMINPEGVIVARNIKGEALVEFLNANIK